MTSPAPPLEAAPVGRRTAALAVLAGAQFLVVLSTSIVNVALPAIDAGLGLSASGMAWVVNAYVLAFGALLLLGGRAGDLLGRRRVFLAGVVLFGVGTLAAGLAPSAAVLITARAVQGVGAAALAPAAMSLVVALYPEGPARGRALAVWGAVSAVGGAAGILLGGVVTGGLGWRWVFLVGVPVAVAVLAAALVVVAPDTPGGGARADVPGAALVTAGLVALVTALSGGRGWTDPVTLGLLGASAVLLAGFVWWQRRSAHPMVPLRIFTTARVGAASVGMTVLGSVWVGMFFFLPLYQQRVLGYTPLLAGLTQLPLAAANTAGSWLTPRVSARWGEHRTLVASLLALASGLLWLGAIRADGTFAVDLLGPSVVVGLGLSASFVLFTGAAVAGVPARDLGLASGLSNATRQIGGAVGLAVLTAIAAARTAALPGVPAPEALTSGYRAAFLTAAAVIAALSLYVARAFAGAPVPGRKDPS
ncbi:DHA2 family efflux MFS transporter permease subunit [Saccharothrix syringae]|uniref:DHA2 family efflux MFS transporter permease subunit n=1 Tax=Saccharothrix syringae TaxID=103733 RepID=A0A5Q0GY40_SACSY|nr:DHA2 family efflux MFS transporter permease subunit [Saccharothrix syringae]QFZ18595.1 DHA2 family efflux MFS transporter permease subunit [Saccharothrix syringae]